MGTTAEFNEEKATHYQSQIGVLHWIVELGKLTLQQMLHSQERDLETVFNIYAYLKKRYNSRLALDPSYPEIDMRVFHQADWTDFYGMLRRLYLTMPQNQEENQSF